MIMVLKMTKKYTHNMIWMSRYKGQLHGGKKGQQIWAGVPPPLFENIFLSEMLPKVWLKFCYFWWFLVLKMTKKYTHNMIWMSRYKGQLHGGKKGQQIRARPLFGQCPKENVFFMWGVP